MIIKTYLDDVNYTHYKENSPTQCALQNIKLQFTADAHYEIISLTVSY